ncbi:SRPBCC family protein [Rhodococcus sp. X156]|uniref:SRPBCC family protein n=1 Tax=Rhodococcus sp. X156 TaxID=2499145 RepID=UPI000FD93223|nr:SRPBCC family protein [Rhodococcus sp. X156]
MADTQVTTVETGPRRVSRRVVVDATPAEVFALAADPRRHGELDGSGTVRDSVKAPDTLSKGAKFSVSMKMYGVPYRITSTVVDFEPDRVIEWRHPMGHTWRWELAPVSPGQTEVVETFSYGTHVLPKALELVGVPKMNGTGITRTLEKLQQRFAS